MVVTTGREKGKRGTVLRVLEPSKVLVEGVNRVEEAPAAEPDEGHSPAASSTRRCRSHISNVVLLNPATGKGDRVGFKFLEAQDDGRAQVRFFKSNGEVVDV